MICCWKWVEKLYLFCSNPWILSFFTWCLKNHFCLKYRFTGSCKDNPVRSCVPPHWFPLMVTSYVTIVQCQNQETSVGTMCVDSLVWGYKIIKWSLVEIHNHHCNQDNRTIPSPERIPLCYPFIVTLFSFLFSFSMKKKRQFWKIQIFSVVPGGQGNWISGVPTLQPEKEGD